MGKSNRSKNIGKGKVTPTQIAFIVDRYLHKNRFSETRNLFRTEAWSLLSKSPVREVPESLIPLDDILNEYICLKEEKMGVDQERVRLDQEKFRVQNLLQGMQKVMNTYNSSLITPPAVGPASQKINYGITSSGYGQYNTPSVMPVSLLGNKRVEFGKFSTPLASQAITGKRKGPEVSVVAPPVSRKPRTTKAQEKSTANEANKIPQADKAANNLSSQTQTLAKNCSTNELMTGDGSSVAKCLFNKADSSIPTNSTCLRTPQKHASSPGSDKSNSPQKELEVTPTNCTIFTKERFTISPLKQITSYTVERSHLVSSSSPVKSNLKMSNKREHVKGRLNFDDTDTEKFLEAPASTAPLVATSPSGSDPEVDLFDMDFSNLDFLGENFSISELLVDFDLACEGSTLNPPMETASGLSPESRNGNLEPDQTISEYTTTVNGVIQGKDMSTQGDDANTAATKVLNEMHTDLESCHKLQAENDVKDN